MRSERRKGPTGRRPEKGEAEARQTEDPEEERSPIREDRGEATLRGEPEKRDAFWGFVSKREPARSKALREPGPRPDLIDPGAERGTAFMAGGSRWSAGSRPMRFRRKAPERRGGMETFHRSLWKRKASRGEAQERWELKEASEGSGTEDTERVAKP